MSFDVGISRKYCFRLILTVIFPAIVHPFAAWGTDCDVEATTRLAIAHVRIQSAKLIISTGNKPAYCDIRGSVATDGEGAGPGSAQFDLMLPEIWNGKYVFSGGRGTGGSLASAANPVDLEQFMTKGYAAVTTDEGHSNSDKKWNAIAPGTGNMPRLVDYFYRAVHQVTEATKKLVLAYYQKESISHAYFEGCSNGGREALMEAARYPEDYDGIIAGSAWFDPVGSTLSDLKNVKAFEKAHIPFDKLDAIDAAILDQCDALDGVKDGLIQNPAACSFKPGKLVPSVLTTEQAHALETYFSAVKDEKGNLIFPGTPVSDLKMQFGLPGARMVEMEDPPVSPNAAQPWGGNEFPHLWTSAAGVILTLGYRDGWVDMNNNVENDGGKVKPEALNMLYGRLRADIVDDPASLDRYFGRGGKLILYHGLSDPIISPYSAIWFYQDLADRRGGYDGAQKNARLFLLPATQHCNDGPTPTRFDSLTALENWVEKGNAPESIASTRMHGTVPQRGLPLCKFPEMPHYKGSGDTRDIENWFCDPGDKSMLVVGLNGDEAGLNQRKNHTKLVRNTPGEDLGR